MRPAIRYILSCISLFLVGLYVVKLFPSSLAPVITDNHGENVLYDTHKRSSWTYEMRNYCSQVEERIEKEVKDRVWESLSTNYPTLVSPNFSKNSTKQSNEIPYYYSNWRSSPKLRRRVTPCEHLIFTELLSTLDAFFRRHDISYIIMDGTLLGSYAFHDIMPWDDDVDIRIANRDRSRMFSLLDQELGHIVNRAEMNNEFGTYDIIYFPWAPKIGKTKHSYPYVDIVFMDENKTHMWNENLKSNSMHECSLSKNDIFPVVWRPFGQIWLPTPREPEIVFATRRWKKIGKVYFAKDFSHKFLKHMPLIEGQAKASQLYSYYPWVERNCNSDQCSERLWIRHNKKNITIHVIKFEKYLLEATVNFNSKNSMCSL